ncbi:Monooxygenase FAD-binding [Penicillium expansum]|nr:Monooxygenase FAD-binding [Penicillium expansum]
MEKPKFKVIIVGGSITGLTLAHCLLRAGIDHVILEKRAEIAPQEGAFIGIWPNGAQVLQQLGVYESMEKLTAPIDRMHISYPDGFSFSSLLPKEIHKLLKYPVVSLDRQKVLEVLYQSYPDKSKIIVNKRVLQVQLSTGNASVVTDDGKIYTGDLIVGADGVHSRIRSEMWRLADELQPGLITPKERKALTVEYACLFGISQAIPGLQSGDHVNRYGDKFCIITFHGKADRVFWFIIHKLDQVYTYPDAPRYSPADATELCGKLRHVKIVDDVTVGDLWETKEVASMTALEEGLFENWHFKRIVLLGDSIHKMTPNIGQGANTAIEDVAVLSSQINRLVNIDGIQKPLETDIEAMLQEYKIQRFDRAKGTCARASFGARFHTRDDRVKAFVGRYIFPHIGSLIVRRTSKILSGGDILDYLPVPDRNKENNHTEISTKTNLAPRPWAMLWITSLLVCLLIPWIRSYLLSGLW